MLLFLLAQLIKADTSGTDGEKKHGELVGAGTAAAL